MPRERGSTGDSRREHALQPCVSAEQQQGSRLTWRRQSRLMPGAPPGCPSQRACGKEDGRGTRRVLAMCPPRSCKQSSIGPRQTALACALLAGVDSAAAGGGVRAQQPLQQADFIHRNQVFRLPGRLGGVRGLVAGWSRGGGGGQRAAARNRRSVGERASERLSGAAACCSPRPGPARYICSHAFISACAFSLSEGESLGGRGSSWSGAATAAAARHTSRSSGGSGACMAAG